MSSNLENWAESVKNKDPNGPEAENKDNPSPELAANEPYQPKNKWEERAVAMGWKPKDEWHGDEEDWTPAREYVRVGEVLESNRRLQSKIDKTEADIHNRINDVQNFYKNQMQMQREQLEAQRDKAAENGNMDDYRETNDKLKKLDEQEADLEPTSQPNQNVGQSIVDTPEVQAYVQANPWIQGDDPKAVFAQQKFIHFVNANKDNKSATVQDALNYMHAQVQEFYPDVGNDRNNRNRERPSMGDKGGGPAPRGKKHNTLTWNDLTKEELTMYSKFYKGQDKEKFLKTVADCRIADGGS